MKTTSYFNHLKQQQNKKTNFKKKFVAFIQVIVCHLINFFKRMIKAILKFATKLTEIERICHRERIESIRIRKIGN